MQTSAVALAAATLLGLIQASNSAAWQDESSDQEQETTQRERDQADNEMQDRARESSDDDSPPEPIVAPAQALGYSGQFLLRDGATLAGARGRLIQHELGYWEFVVEQQDASREPATFIVLPSRTLSRMEQAASEDSAATMFELTGTVHVFEGMSYVLPLTAPRIVISETNEVPSESSVAEQSTTPADVDASQLTAEQIIRNVERNVPVARSLAVEENEQMPIEDVNPSLAPRFGDGSILMARRGRITRTADGGWRFNFAADAAGLSDPPMVLLPCHLLESIRDRVQSGGAGQVFLITGQAFSYRGRSFLLPTMFRIEDVDRNPNIRR